LLFIDPIRRELIASVKVVTGTIRSVAFSPDGHRIAIGASDGSLRLLDDRSIEERQPMVGSTRERKEPTGR
jgi:WD40 repeat protein